MLATILGSVGIKLAAFVAGALALLGVVFTVRKSGVQAQKNADLQQSLQNVKAADATHHAVAQLADPAVDQQLRQSFSRD